MDKYLYSIFYAKRYVEQFIMFPFILIGRLLAIINPLKKEYDIVLIFRTYEIGGAERVNAEVLEALNDKKVLVLFTKKTPNNGMLHFFERENADIHDISKWADNKIIYFMNFVCRGKYAHYINSMKDVRVFIGQNNFGYKITPHIKRRIHISELLHAYVRESLWSWAPFIKFMDTRIIVGDVFLKKLADVYEQFGIPKKYTKNLKVIRYCLEYIPESKPKKEFELPLKVYYAGRGGAQKRVWILLRIIEECTRKELPLIFTLAGPFRDEVPQHLIDDGTYVGEIKGGKAMYDFHTKHDLMLMTSGWEGFPIAIMEALAFGSTVLVPAVDAIPENIKHGHNGFIISEVTDEDKMVEEAVAHLEMIIKRRNDLGHITGNAFTLLQERFTKKKFAENYRVLFGFKPMS